MIEQLLQRLRLPFGEECLPAAPAPPQGYRNYLETGQLSVFHRSVTPWDLTADAVATRLLAAEHRHAAFEMVRNELDWYVAACERCTLTPPLLLLPKEESPALRDQAVPLAHDNSYWWALCQPAHRIVLDGDHNGMLTPAVNRELMGPDGTARHGAGAAFSFAAHAALDRDLPILRGPGRSAAGRDGDALLCVRKSATRAVRRSDA